MLSVDFFDWVPVSGVGESCVRMPRVIVIGKWSLRSESFSTRHSLTGMRLEETKDRSRADELCVGLFGWLCENRRLAETGRSR